MASPCVGGKIFSTPPLVVRPGPLVENSGCPHCVRRGAFAQNDINRESVLDGASVKNHYSWFTHPIR